MPDLFQKAVLEANKRSNLLRIARAEMEEQKDYWHAVNFCICKSNLDEQTKANRAAFTVIDNIWTAL